MHNFLQSDEAFAGRVGEKNHIIFLKYLRNTKAIFLYHAEYTHKIIVSGL